MALTAAARPGRLARPAGPSRIASVRIFQDQQFTAKRQTPASIGAALARAPDLRLVADPLRRRAEGTTARGARMADDGSRGAGHDPGRQVRVELNPIEFRNARALHETIDRIRPRSATTAR